MPTRERAIKERGKQLKTLLMATYLFPEREAEYIVQKAVERAKEGLEFRVQVDTGLLAGELVADLTTMLCLSCSLRGTHESA